MGLLFFQGGFWAGVKLLELEARQLLVGLSSHLAIPAASSPEYSLQQEQLGNVSLEIA